MSNHSQFMQRAIELSRQAGIEKKTGGCFGSVIVKDNTIIAEGYNQVLEQHDPTCHAEMQAIRNAAQALGQFHLEGCVLYSSAEPCPMCLGAAYWAHIDKIYYAASYQDVEQFGDFDDQRFADDMKKPIAERELPLEQIEQERAVAVWRDYIKSSSNNY